MSEVLSQNEIDSLLSALSNGELDADEIKDSGEKQVKDYDFARPAKLRVFALIVKTLFSKLGIKSYLRAQFHFRKQDYGI